MVIPLTIDNIVCNAEFQKMEKVINVSRELGERVSCCPLYHAWKYMEETDTFELITLTDNNTLRKRRKAECFDLIDHKSKLWWDSLSEKDNAAVKQWYADWLAVTETKVIPALPDILKAKEE